MSGTELDRIFYTFDGEIGPYKRKLADLENAAGASGSKIGENLSKSAKGGAEALHDTIKKVADVTGVANAAGAKIGDNLARSAKGAEQLHNNVKNIADVAGTAAIAGGKIGEHLEHSAKGAHALHRGIEVSRRELLYAGREIATGDWARLPSTLALISSHMVGITSTGILAGGALAAPFIAMGLAAYQSERVMSALETSISRVGAATGITPGQVLMMAQGQSIPGVSTNGAVTMSAALLARGNVSGTQLPSAVQASSLYSKAEGLSEDKGAAAFERILSDPTKGAIELHDAMKLLSSSQMEQIEHLQREGDLRGAQNIIIDATTRRLSSLSDQAGPLAKKFEDLSKRASDWWASMGRRVSVATGLKNETPEEENARLRKRYFDLSTGTNTHTGNKNADEASAAIIKKAGDDWLASSRRLSTTQASTAAATTVSEADDHRKEFIDKMRSIDPQFGRRLSLDEDNVSIKRQIENVRGLLADPRSSPEARRQAQADLVEARRGLAANAWAMRTGKPPSEYLSTGFEDPVARRLKEVQTAISGANSVGSAYGQSTAAGRAAAIQARVNQEMAGLKTGQAPAGYADLLTKKYTAEDASGRQQKLRETIDRMQDENGLLALHTQLMGADEDVRNKQLAQQEAINRVTEEYGDLNSTAAKNALAATLKEVNAKQDLLKTIKDINDEQHAELDMAHDLTDVIEGPLKKMLGKNPLMQLFGKYALFDPLENAIQGGVTGTPGTKPTLSTMGGLFSKLFGGPGGGAGKPDGSPMNPLHVVMSAGGAATSGISDLMKPGGISKMYQGSWLQTAASSIGNFLGFANGGAWSGGVRYAANGMVLGGATMFATGSGPVIGGEMGKNSEALMPLARGPGGVLGVRAHGAMGRAPIHVHQSIAIHPDVSAVARGEIFKMLPTIKTEAVSAVSEAMSRGAPMGAGTV